LFLAASQDEEWPSMPQPPKPRKARPRKPVARIAYSIPEWAQATGQNRASVWRQIQKGRLRTIRVGERTMIPTTEIKQE
jgi:hypothetical protein